jgi:hypothetical protein
VNRNWLGYWKGKVNVGDPEADGDGGEIGEDGCQEKAVDEGAGQEPAEVVGQSWDNFLGPTERLDGIHPPHVGLIGASDELDTNETGKKTDLDRVVEGAFVAGELSDFEPAKVHQEIVVGQEEGGLGDPLLPGQELSLEELDVGGGAGQEEE